MSWDLFVSDIQAQLLLTRLRRIHVYAQAPIVNQDYQGSINEVGDVVHATAIGEVTLFDYVKGQDIPSPQQLSDSDTAIAVDQAKGFNYSVPGGIDRAILKPQIMAEATKSTEWGINQYIDKFIAGMYTSAAQAYGSSGSPITPSVGTDANVGSAMFDRLVHLNTMLDEADVPPFDRWAVLAPFQKEMLYEDKRFTGQNTPEAVKMLQQGFAQANGGQPLNNFLGMIDNMLIFWTNNAPLAAGTKGQTGEVRVVLAGQGMAITFAEGFAAMRAYEPEKRIAEEAVKGNHCWGGKAIRPDALVAGYFARP